MAELALRGLCKDFGSGYVVKDVNLDVADAEFCVLVGASGSGKSTILRMTAGLERPTDGEIYLDDRLINEVRPGDRDMAMVFQNYALYAHMNVANNLGYSLRIRKVPKEERQEAVQAVAEMLQITPLLQRKPRQLSGGERQRVALGRAIIRKPKLFLMDEPLSNLDALLRVQMRTEILKLQRSLCTTTVYVTHDQVEAMSMADKLVVLHNGLVEQVGTPQEIYNHPVNRYVASFIGTPVMNFIEPGELRYEDGHWHFACPDFSLTLPASAHADLQARHLTSGAGAAFGIRPEALCIGPAPAEWEASLSVPACIELTQNLGSEIVAFANIGHQTVAASVDSSVMLYEGEQIQLSFDLRRMHLFDAETGEAWVTSTAPAVEAGCVV